MDNAVDPEAIAFNLYSIVQCIFREHTGCLQAEMKVWRPLVDAGLSCDLRGSSIGDDPREKT